MGVSWKLALFCVCVGILIHESQSWLFTSKPGCKKKRNNYDTPYYFGHTDLNCLFRNIRQKRNAPWRFPYAYKHGWIQYKGHYFEFGVDPTSKGYLDYAFSATKPYRGHRCTYQREENPAGYSRLSIDCVKRCTRSYRYKYGGYNLHYNNCNMFANRLSKILCSNKCPKWCI